MSVNKFWTVTDGNTAHTNSRSSRYGTLQGAVSEATARIKSGRSEDVFILESVRLVRRIQQPVEIIEVI